ncbi:hypothetical protein SAMN05421676_107112 [Salinibacillus kushneri]|uniref:Zinc-finger n=1 Tax=Salinibacillus kushneri TaxID=237682 RepID=A0A1I0GQD4_9BACI|nr:hypothetical protein [Salinibacillus kushneri]SET73229.1 hypothetical protein SAMN05421676_107112 [Salinibacillus kushneri]
MSSHMEWEILQQYVVGQLLEDNQRKVEDHLSECDICFDHYMGVIEEWSVPFSVSHSFTDDTLEKLQTVQPKLANESSKSSSREVHRKTIGHYVLAAGLTVLLMFTGVFDMLFSLNDQIKADDPSISEQILESNFLDSLNNGKEEKGNE